MNLYFDLPLDAGDDLFHAVVEIPRGDRIKYEYSEQYGAIFVDRVFRTPVAYPQNYGFFPQTWNKYDKDPMDVIVVANEAFHPGVVVPVRVIGIIEMDDTGESDHKILAVPNGHSDYAHCQDIDDLDSEIVANLEWFLEHYKDREPEKEVRVIRTKGRFEALDFLKECSEEYRKKHA